MVKVAKLEADLVANTSQFEEGFKRAGKQLLSFGNIAKATLGSQIISGAAHKFVDALKSITTSQFHVIEETGNLARSLGESTREFQAQSRVAREARVDQDTLAKSIVQTQKAIIGAASGNEKYERAFAAINLRAADLIKLSPDKQYEKIAIGLSKVENATQRTVLVQDLFGKGGRASVNMLDDYAKKLDAARAFNDKFGISLSEIDVAKVEEANTTFDRVKEATKGLGNIIAINLAPAITGIGEALLDAGVDGEDFGKVVRGAIEFIAISVDNLRTSILGIRYVLAEVARDIDLFVLDASKKFFELSKATSDFAFPDAIFGKGLSKAEETFLNINKNAQAAADTHMKTLKDLEAEAGNFVSVNDKINKAIQEANERAAKTVAGRTNTGEGGAPSVVNPEDEKKIKSIIDGLKEESDQLKLQATLYGKKESAAHRAQEELKIQNKLAAEGIVLTEKQRDLIDQYLDSIERQSEANSRLARAENARQEAIEGFSSALATNLEDAIVDVDSLGDALENLGKTVERIVTRLLITGPLEDALSDFLKDGTSSSQSSSGIFGKLLSFLPSFAVGSDNVPYDMIAQIHKGEKIIPAAEANKMRSSGDSGINLSLKIVDNVGVKVSQQTSQGANGPEMTVVLDQIVADNLSRKGSKSNQAFQALTNQTLIRR